MFVLPRCRHDHVRAVHKQAYSLAQAGHEVVLVVKHGDVTEYMGMRVVSARVPFENILRPVLNLPALFKQVVSLDGDMYLLSNPDSIPLALVLKLSRKNVIYSTEEDFSKRFQLREAVPNWLEPALAWFVSKLERWLGRVTDGVLVTQSHQLKSIGGNTLLLLNAPLLGGPIVELADSIRLCEQHDGIRLIYAGGITESRGLFQMLELMQALNLQRSCILDLLGKFESVDLKERAEQHPGWQFVNYRGEVSHAASLAHIKNADIGLAILDRVADYPTTSITKLFEYMQYGVPFVASDFPAWRIQTSMGVPGFYVDPDSVGDIRDLALRLASDSALRARMGKAGRHYVETEFSWERISQPFVAMVDRVIGDDTKKAGRYS